MTDDVTSAPGGLKLGQEGAAALAVLDGDGVGNRVSAEAIAALAGWYPKLARDAGVYAAIIRSSRPGVFSTGLDDGPAEPGGGGAGELARAGLAGMLRLCWLHECFSKPTVALVDGLVEGTGTGLISFGTHRVAGEGYSLVLPATAEGRVPGCGIAYFLARMPHAIGVYLGLTGAAVGRADAYALGLVTHCVRAAAFPQIIASLADADPVDPVLDGLHEAPGEGEIMAAAGRIARYFGAGDVAGILERLSRPLAADAAWAAATLDTLKRRSLLALHLTFHAIREARQLDIRQTLLQDYRVAIRLIETAEGGGGGRGEALTEGVIGRFFLTLGAHDLALPSRAEMQAARV